MAFVSRTINSNSQDIVNVHRESRNDPGMTEVSKTLFLPLFFRAQETLEGGIIEDNTAVEIVHRLGYDNKNFRLDREMQLIISLRTIILDKIVEHYIVNMRQSGREPVVINLGAGLDTRQQRLPQAQWYHVDLLKPIALREQYLPQSGAVNIAASIFDEGWTDSIVQRDEVLIIIEGVLMYFDESMEHTLFKTIADTFRKSIIAFDTLARRYTSLQAHQSIDVNKAPFLCGVSNSNDVERWNMGFRTLKEYGYYQEYLAHFDRLRSRYRIIRFDATHKVYVMTNNNNQ